MNQSDYDKDLKLRLLQFLKYIYGYTEFSLCQPSKVPGEIGKWEIVDADIDKILKIVEEFIRVKDLNLEE